MQILLQCNHKPILTPQQSDPELQRDPDYTPTDSGGNENTGSALGQSVAPVGRQQGRHEKRMVRSATTSASDLASVSAHELACVTQAAPSSYFAAANQILQRA